MRDPDYWKQQYKHAWQHSSRREKRIAKKIRAETGREVVPTGLGAGSEAYLSGSAASHGHERGGADLKVVGTNIEVEVTGPLVANISADRPLWIRPDKINHAFTSKSDVWVVHELGDDGLKRAIELGNSFMDRAKNDTFRTIRPVIRGVREKYVEIPADDVSVRPFSDLIEYIKRA